MSGPAQAQVQLAAPSIHDMTDIAEDFQKSCPWYFMFKKLDTGTRLSPPKTKTSPEVSISEWDTTSSGEDVEEPSANTSIVAPPARVVDPTSLLQPKPRRPGPLPSPPQAASAPREEQGYSRQTPIEIDSDSDSSSVVELTDYFISKTKTATKKTTPYVEATS